MSLLNIFLYRKKKMFWLRRPCWTLCSGLRSSTVSGPRGTARTSSVWYVSHAAGQIEDVSFGNGRLLIAFPFDLCVLYVHVTGSHPQDESSGTLGNNGPFKQVHCMWLSSHHLNVCVYAGNVRQLLRPDKVCSSHRSEMLVVP